MMGRQSGDQDRLFYDVSLDGLVPKDHLVRRIDAVLDLAWLRAELAPYYSHIGRPSIDPELMIRMLIVGYVFAIRAERQLCSEVQVNMAYRWFCGLGLEDAIPNHSAFSRARHERFREADILRRVFEAVVEACLAADLVGGDAFSVDASLIRADVNQVKRVPGTQADADCEDGWRPRSRQGFVESETGRGGAYERAQSNYSDLGLQRSNTWPDNKGSARRYAARAARE